MKRNEKPTKCDEKPIKCNEKPTKFDEKLTKCDEKQRSAMRNQRSLQIFTVWLYKPPEHFPLCSLSQRCLKKKTKNTGPTF